MCCCDFFAEKVFACNNVTGEIRNIDGEKVSFTSISPNGKYILIGYIFGLVRVLATDTLNEICQLKLHTRKVRACKFSPDN